MGPGPVTTEAIGPGFATRAGPNPREPAVCTIENLTDGRVAAAAALCPVPVLAARRVGTLGPARSRSAVPGLGAAAARGRRGPGGRPDARFEGARSPTPARLHPRGSRTR
ncbi:hypothetical protein GCM10010495_76440 [Kitasatospora herbaricolor]|nr:hypothetical protein GCM10010495_76440 [Kitasatospora herbaricolor]